MLKYIPILLVFFAASVFSQNGIVKSYYGPKKLRSKLSFVKDQLDGTSYWYYENGNLQAERSYNQGKQNGWAREYFESGLLKEEYFTRNGIKDGHNRIYWDNGALKELRTYDMGKLVKRVQIDYDPLYIAPVEDYNVATSYAIEQDKEEYICNADICPSPIGGMNAVQEKVVYPSDAKIYGLEGTVAILATVNTNGIVDSAKLIRGIGLGCDEAAIEAVKNTRFIPAQTNGETVNSNVTLYVDFNLEKQKQVDKRKVEINKRLASIEPELSKYFSTDNVSSKSAMAQVLGTDDLGVDEEKENMPKTDSYKIATEYEIESPQDEIAEEKEEVYRNLTCEIDDCPAPAGGMEALIRKFDLPRTAKRLKLYGEVVIEADVDEYGNVRDTKIVKDPGGGCGMAAEMAVLDTKFVAGRENGELVRAKVILVIPVRTLDEE